MSRLDAFLQGLTFRTATPTFDAGDELTAIVTGQDGEDSLCRIGDTVLRVADADLAVDAEVRLRVTDFDDDEAVGEAELV